MLAKKLSVAANIENEVLVQMLTRLSSVAAEDKPFPHFFIENIFPQHIYDALLDSLPEPETMQPMGDRHRNQDGSYNRFQLLLRPAAFDKMRPEQAALWQGVHRALIAPQFKQAVFAKLKSGLSFRYGIRESEVSQLAGHPLTTLIRETEGYYIAPHPDTRKKVVTMQFAMPRDRSQADLGTTFYRRSIAPADWLKVPRGFKSVKQMPFIPNCCYGFAVLNTISLKSWHGREEIQGDQGIRNSLLHLYYGQPQDESQGYEQ